MISEVSIINFGLGNFASISNLIAYLGGESKFIHSPEEILKADKLILPGVGHFDSGMKLLRMKDLEEALKTRVTNDRIPILGICLGMQMLCNGSEEGSEKGLGLLDAEVCKFKFNSESKLKIPHMGWNNVTSICKNPILPMTDDERRFYFVHSYHVVPNKQSYITAVSNYGNEFCAAIQKENIFGVQFHPEKSHRFGKELMKNFLEL